RPSWRSTARGRRPRAASGRSRSCTASARTTDSFELAARAGRLHEGGRVILQQEAPRDQLVRRALHLTHVRLGRGVALFERWARIAAQHALRTRAGEGDLLARAVAAVSGR